MKIGDWVQWDLAELMGVKLTPVRGWIIAAEGDWFVVRVSSMKPPQSPFATFHRSKLALVPESELVQRGARLIS